MNIPVIVMPPRFERLKPAPEDPPYIRSYGYQSSNALCYVIFQPIPRENAMPYDDPQPVIDGIHAVLEDDQGLIAVETSRTKGGLRYIYSIVKSLKEPCGVQYCLTMHFECLECSVQVQGFFDEAGMTGMRDAMVYSMLSNEGKVEATENGIIGWNEDPYDPEFKRGNCMNCAERKEYDELFPEHPLSELRKFVAEVVELN